MATPESVAEPETPVELLSVSDEDFVYQQQHTLRKAMLISEGVYDGLRDLFEENAGKRTSFSGYATHYLIKDTDKIMPYHVVVGLPESNPQAGAQRRLIEHQELIIVKAMTHGVVVDNGGGDALPIVLYGTIDFRAPEHSDEAELPAG
jgi:hypothetical protein